MRLTTCSTWQPAVGILLADPSSSCRSPSLEKACRSRRGRHRSRTCQHRSTSSSFECLKNLETSHMMRFRRCKQMWWWCEACLQGSYSMDCPLYGKGERLVVGHKSPSRIMHHASFMFFSLHSLSGCCKVLGSLQLTFVFLKCSMFAMFLSLHSLLHSHSWGRQPSQWLVMAKPATLLLVQQTAFLLGAPLRLLCCRPLLQTPTRPSH